MKFSNLTLKPRPRHLVLLVLFATVTMFKMMAGWGDVYTHSIYPIIGRCLSAVSGLLPFALGDVFIALSILWVVGYPVYSICYRKRRKKPTFCRVAEYLAWVYVWFYATWGLNYSQSNIYRRIGMRPAEASANRFKQFANDYADSLNVAYAKAGNAAYANSSLAYADIKRRSRLSTWQGYSQLEHMGINKPFNPDAHAKTMLFSTLSSMAGITGSMAPFFGEFTLNADIRPHQYPAIYAHEYAHQLGIANEGEANFYSYIVCTSSTDGAVRFSGYYHILPHVLGNAYNLLGEKEYEAYLKRINPAIISLAKSDRQYWLARHSRIVDETQNFFYNLYLKGNRVEGGTKSYSGVIGIIMAWENRTANSISHRSK